MTYIEFFDLTAAKNICTCLTDAPDRVIYIGDNAKLMKKHIADYERVFKDRGQSISFSFRTVAKSSLEAVTAILSEIVETYDDCVFDITGGEETILLALGIVYARYPEKNIQIHKINLMNNAIYDFDMDGKTVYKEVPSLSAKENVRIYGGDIVYGGVFDNKTYLWDLNVAFTRDVETMWAICKENVKSWNAAIRVLEAVEGVGTAEEGSLTTVAPLGELEKVLARNKIKYEPLRGILKRLAQAGLLTAYTEGEDSVTVSYKDNQVKKCLTKAGQVLEMKVYLTAKKAVGADGAPVYGDVQNGVLIDWDGEVHSDGAENAYDTENEIDILMMHNMIPVFVSCKNGFVPSEELYKLSTVAERFGGRYAKKVLLTTAVSAMGTAGEHLRQRAKDMNIKLLEDVQLLDDAAFERMLKNLWCS